MIMAALTACVAFGHGSELDLKERFGATLPIAPSKLTETFVQVFSISILTRRAAEFWPGYSRLILVVSLIVIVVIVMPDTLSIGIALEFRTTIERKIVKELKVVGFPRVLRELPPLNNAISGGTWPQGLLNLPGFEIALSGFSRWICQPGRERAANPCELTAL